MNIEYEGQRIRKKASDYEDNGYKILCGHKYLVYRSEYGGSIFYKIKITKTSRDNTNTKITAYKNVSFANKNKDCNIKNETVIIPTKIMEDFFFSKKDSYNAIWYVVILDWEVVRDEEELLNDAIDNYQTEKRLQVNDEDLPF